MSREKVIRATAGSFVLLSLSLGWWVHPGFYLMTAFVGVNLLQSSFTGFCPLNSVLDAVGIAVDGAGEAR